jgi:hypothetical protein
LPLSIWRRSEYPADYFIGILIKAAAMAEYNSLRLPRVDFFDRRFRLSPLEEQRQPHAKEYLPPRMIHSGELGDCSPRLGNLIQFDVNDRISEYQCPRSFVKENVLLEIAAGKKQLVDLFTPFIGRVGVKVSSDSTFTPRARCRTRGDAHETVSGNAFAHSPICA